MKTLFQIIFIFSFLISYSQEKQFENIEYIFNKSTTHQKTYAIVNSGGKLRIAPSPLSEQLVVFEKHDSIQLIDFESGYWAIMYNNKIGYLSDLYVEQSISTEQLRNRILEQKSFEANIKKQLEQFDQRIYVLQKEIEDSIRENEKAKYQLEIELLNKKLEDFNNLSVANQWDLLVQISGCLVGGQNCHNGKCGNPACIMSKNENWNFFLKQEKNDLVPFLIDRISDTTETNVHTCPFFQAKAGELSIYSLQFIYKLNWNEIYADYKVYKNQELNGIESSDQAYIWRIISDPKALEKMQKGWQKIYKK